MSAPARSSGSSLCGSASKAPPAAVPAGPVGKTSGARTAKTSVNASVPSMMVATPKREMAPKIGGKSPMAPKLTSATCVTNPGVGRMAAPPTGLPKREMAPKRPGGVAWEMAPKAKSPKLAGAQAALPKQELYPSSLAALAEAKMSAKATPKHTNGAPAATASTMMPVMSKTAAPPASAVPVSQAISVQASLAAMAKSVRGVPDKSLFQASESATADKAGNTPKAPFMTSRAPAPKAAVTSAFAAPLNAPQAEVASGLTLPSMGSPTTAPGPLHQLPSAVMSAVAQPSLQPTKLAPRQPGALTAMASPQSTLPQQPPAANATTAPMTAPTMSTANIAGSTVAAAPPDAPSTASVVKAWNPATGEYVQEEIPSEIRDLMGEIAGQTSTSLSSSEQQEKPVPAEQASNSVGNAEQQVKPDLNLEDYQERFLFEQLQAKKRRLMEKLEQKEKEEKRLQEQRELEQRAIEEKKERELQERQQKMQELQQRLQQQKQQALQLQQQRQQQQQQQKQERQQKQAALERQKQQAQAMQQLMMQQSATMQHSLIPPMPMLGQPAGVSVAGGVGSLPLPRMPGPQPDRLAGVPVAPVVSAGLPGLLSPAMLAGMFPRIS
eukprot:TRINITY_DN3005_c1_g1_i1.p1 TRINITY_DN3005_c1_g1~~TRINITY_DN3005_c1_g1_i1.p1  ORF type:complete len:609 (-),score=145.19 TRINITY_DN3005_c1_g1_i1:316-2142(-)